MVAMVLRILVPALRQVRAWAQPKVSRVVGAHQWMGRLSGGRAAGPVCVLLRSVGWYDVLVWPQHHGCGA